MTKAAVSLESKFPDYLGLGKLAPDSILSTSEKMNANYVVDGQVIFEVEIGTSGCQLTEFFRKEQVAFSTSQTLADAFTRLMLLLPPSNNQRLLTLYDQIARGRNIYIRISERPSVVYFPAGYMYILRQPIVESNRSACEDIIRQLPREGNSAAVRFDARHPAVLLQLLRSGQVRESNITVADFNCTLFDLRAAADLLWQSRIVPQEKEYRLAVMDPAESLPGNIQIHKGDIAQGFSAFALVITDGLNMPLARVIELFRDAARKL